MDATSTRAHILPLTAALIIMCAACLPVLTDAQEIDIPGSATALSISMTPEHPAPQSQVRLTLTSPIFNLKSSTITWRVANTVLAQGVGVTSADVTTAGVGESTTVSVSVSSSQGESSASITIIPSRVSLLWEAQSYTHPFYNGRALPAAGSTIKVLALAQLSAGGRILAPDTLTYTWRRNDTVLGSLSGRGKSAVTIPAPMLFGTDVITVVVTSSDGATAGEASLQLQDEQTDLMLYLDHPLFGTLFHRALGSATDIAEVEMTFAAYPLFAPVSNAFDPRLAYAWRVNQAAVASDKSAANELTINAANSSGAALVELTVTHSTNFFFDATGAWRLAFNKSNSSANPFYAQ